MPAYNEAGSIAMVLRQIFEQLVESHYRFEVVVVDDGSEDATADIVTAFLDRYPVTLLSLTRNFGKEAALLAGLDHAQGDAVVLMDADLQHPVALIPEFLRHWEQGYQCVYGVRQHREDESLLKRIGSKAFYGLLNAGAKTPIPANALDFRLLDKSMVQALRQVRERVRFTKGLYAWLGYRSIGIPFVPAVRYRETTRFGVGSLLKLGWDGLTSFSDLPLRVAGLTGFVVASTALGYGALIGLRTIFFGVDVPGWATLTDGIMFLSGLQMIFLGVIGEYIRNIYIEAKQRPNYVIRERLLSAASVSGAPLEHELTGSNEAVAARGRSQAASAKASLVRA
jgi:glycosyltransferase involved in cell wall biosynthesis